MNLPLSDWSEDYSGTKILKGYSSQCHSSREDDIQLCVDKAVERAIELIAQNLTDDSRYFVCHWDGEGAKLSVAVGDENKQTEQAVSVNLVLQAFQGIEPDEVEDKLRFWLTDYLSTCSGFMNYSLIALFHTGDPRRASLL